MDVRTSLVAEQESAVLGATVDAGDRRPALSVAAVVGEGERAAEWARDRGRVFPEHGV